MRPATREFLRASRSLLSGLHGYVYVRWMNAYVRVLLRLTRHSPPRFAIAWLTARYHGKILTHDHAHAAVTVDRDIRTEAPEQVVPYRLARQIVLTASQDIVAFECACRHIRPVHCEPTRVCMVLGRPTTDLILALHPDSARRLTRQEAVQLLADEHARGHVHTAWFKDAMLDRFYAICNCCKCCCGGIEAMVQHGVPVLVGSGYVAEIDAAQCAACGNCVEACAFHALAGGDGPPALDWDRCMGCGACEAKCSTGAMRLVRDERKGPPLDVRAL